MGEGLGEGEGGGGREGKRDHLSINMSVGILLTLALRIKEMKDEYTRLYDDGEDMGGKERNNSLMDKYVNMFIKNINTAYGYIQEIRS